MSTMSRILTFAFLIAIAVVILATIAAVVLPIPKLTTPAVTFAYTRPPKTVELCNR